jgi:hypothetical protein
MDAAVELQGCIHRVFCHLDPDISRNAAGNQLLRWLSFGGNQDLLPLQWTGGEKSG